MRGCSQRSPSEPPDAGDSNMRNDLTACEGPQHGKCGIDRPRHARAGADGAPRAARPSARPDADRARHGAGSRTDDRLQPDHARADNDDRADPQTAKRRRRTRRALPKKHRRQAQNRPKPANRPNRAPNRQRPRTKATTLPFTGLNLRWIVIGGVLLVAMGARSWSPSVAAKRADGGEARTTTEWLQHTRARSRAPASISR